MFGNRASDKDLEIGTRVRVAGGPLRGEVGTVAEIILNESDPDTWYSLIGNDGQRLWYRDDDGDGNGVFRANDLENI